MTPRHLLRLACGLALLASITTAAPANAGTSSQGTPIVGLQRLTPVREYAGRLLFSRWDGSAYRLSVAQSGRVRDLPVPAQPTPFDADAGPDSNGRPSAVVSLCRGSCDLYVIGFDAGDRLRPVRNANTRGHDEIAPSVWRGRLVFARRYDRDTIVPYTKRLAVPRSRPSARLAQLPARRCGAVDPPRCRRIRDVGLQAMELWGRWVGQSWTYQPRGFSGSRQNEIRLTDVRRTDTRQIAAMSTGIAGQTYLGPAFASGRLAFFRSCSVDLDGCPTDRSGAIRYRISTGAYEIASARTDWSAWAYDGAGDYHVPSAYACAGGDPGATVEPCAIARRTDLRWRSLAADRVR